MTVAFQIPGLPANSLIRVGFGFGVDLTTASSGWVYTDVSSDVMDDPGITISPFGRGDETSQAQPAGCSMTMLNLSGNYSKGAMSPNYPNVKRNTPIQVWISLDNGANWFIRFQGYIAGWNPTWDVSGTLPLVEITAGGTWLRIRKSKKKPLRSPLHRNVVKDSNTIEYWSMEDGSDATQFGSDVGARPALFSNMKLAQNFSDGPDARGVANGLKLTGSGPLPTFDTGGTVTGVCSLNQTGHAWQIDLHYYMPSSPAADTVVFQVNISGGAIAYWTFQINAGGGFYVTTGYNSSGTALVTDGPYALDADVPEVGSWVHLAIFSSDTGGTMTWGNIVSASLGGAGFTDTGTIAGVSGKISSWTVPASAGIVGTQMGHVVVYNTANYTQPGDPAFGYVGEFADSRLRRLCNEEGVEIIVNGISLDVMGAQGIDTFENLVRECEAVDGGLLIDGVSAGFFYRCRSSFYNQAASLTCDVSIGQMDDPFEPVDDDQRNNNLYVVTRKGGASFTAMDEDGPLGIKSIGLYDATPPGGDMNLFSDNALPDQANWFVHLGTVDEPYRYPTLNLDIAAVPALATSWLNTILTNHMDLTNVSSKALNHPPGTVGVLLEGYTETISPFIWTAQCAVSPYRPWEVFQVGDTRLGRIDTDGSSLLAGPYASNATALSVSNKVSAWEGTALPFDIDLAGEQVTVTAIGNIANDTYTRSLSGSWGSADTGQTWAPTGSAVIGVSGSQGTISWSSVGPTQNMQLPLGISDLDMYIDVGHTLGVAPSGGNIITFIDIRLSGSNMYRLQITWTTANDINAVLSRVPGGTLLGPIANLGSGSSTRTVRIQMFGSVLRFKVFGGTEPAYWLGTVVDTNFTANGDIRVSSFRDTGNTNNPTVFTFDNLKVVSPQTLTVTRSVNGVAKSQSTGTAVKLWKPGVLAR